MATLTASGLDATGTLNGYYTGSDNKNLSWQIGQYAAVISTGGINRATSPGVFGYWADPQTAIMGNYNYATTYGGTWISRGQVAGVSGVYTLIQRTA